jgi:hypothetical protein
MQVTIVEMLEQAPVIGGTLEVVDGETTAGLGTTLPAPGIANLTAHEPDENEIELIIALLPHS